MMDASGISISASLGPAPPLRQAPRVHVPNGLAPEKADPWDTKWCRGDSGYLCLGIAVCVAELPDLTWWSISGMTQDCGIQLLGYWRLK